MPTSRPRVLLWTPIARQMQSLTAVLNPSHAELVPCSSEAQAIAELPNADAALVAGVEGGYTAALARAIEASPRVRWLQLVATGREGLDAHGVPARITVTDVGTTSAAVVAEHAMALLLALARRIGPATLATQGATWARDEVLRGIRSLEGMTLCLAGYGRIGKEIARRAQAFGMQCIAVNRSGHNDAPGLATEVLPLTELHRALARAQAVAISLPASPQTLHLFDRAAWAACPRGALVVNVGRGAVIDTDSLTEALHCGQLAGAGLDVTDPEPLPDGHPLWSAPGTLITPHVGGAGSVLGAQRLGALIQDNLQRFAAGEPLRHVVHAPD